MKTSIPFSEPNLGTGSLPPGQKLTLIYSIDKHVVCQTEYRLTANTRFIEIPFLISRLLNGVEM